jgi:hypothetical protein
MDFPIGIVPSPVGLRKNGQKTDFPLSSESSLGWTSLVFS